jgi:hypothetical protein
MSLFVEVFDVEKQCTTIINLDLVAEIAPLSVGGCAIFFADSAGSGARSAMKVKDDYKKFSQLVMQMVTAEDISKRFPTKTPTKTKDTPPIDIPKL